VKEDGAGMLKLLHARAGSRTLWAAATAVTAGVGVAVATTATSQSPSRAWQNDGRLQRRRQARHSRRAHAEHAAPPPTPAGLRREGLPEYSAAAVRAHDGKANKDGTVLVTFRDGVYDITDFVASHPGGKHILLAAGGSIEPFW
jgi:cytochrome b involved in lipid metabolism